jgi:ATP-dependent DNA helicase DinG
MLTDAEKDAIRDHYRTIADNLPGFRPRAAQRRMLAEIANALSRSLEKQGDAYPSREGESIAVIEGPTGVGKSLAYLLAGGVMARARGKKLVVTSATVALQEQLVNRDLPFVVENSGLPLTLALAKGRGRYLCPQRIYALTAENPRASCWHPTQCWPCGTANRPARLKPCAAWRTSLLPPLEWRPRHLERNHR